ncbi:MAG: tyrosine-type recombinase/integrase [Spirochaetaceae bacterium]|nr:tyrosine-type recombinase/integrase [Spirochaetaceae bacterium]
MLLYYLNYLKGQSYSAHSLRAYKKDIENFLAFIGTAANLAALTHNDADRYIMHLKQLGLQNRSIKRHLSSIKGYFNYLERHGKISQNPFAYTLPLKAAFRLPHYYFYNEIENMLNSCTNDNLGRRDRAIIELLYSSGLRAFELVELNNHHFATSSMAIIKGKGSKDRYVFLTGKAKEALADYRLVRMGLAAEGEQALFVNNGGGRLTTRGLYHIIKQYETSLSYGRKVGVHIFRHSFATHLLNEEAGLRQVQELLGHASLSATQVYTHLNTDRLKQAYRQAHPHARVKKE